MTFGWAVLIGLGLFVLASAVVGFVKGWREHDPPDCGGAGAALMQAEPGLDAAQRFGIALGAPLAGPHKDGLAALRPDHADDCLRPSIAEWWSITDRETARERLANLLAGRHEARFQQVKGGDTSDATETELAFVAAHPEVESIVGWDLVRAGCVARWSFGLGYIAREEAWDWIHRAGRLAQQRFRSFGALTESYLLGREFWGGPQGLEELAKVRTLMAGEAGFELPPWNTRLPLA